jgi:hypothetical protein
MECYKEYPRSIGLLTSLAAIVYLMAGSALMLAVNPWFAGGFAALYAIIHYVHYPRSACVHCYYYGRNCISLKGRWAKLLYKRGSETRFYSGMRRAMRGIYLLWVYPFLVLVGAQIMGRPILIHDLLLVAVLIALMVMRQLMRRSLGCRTCMMREQCPNIGPDTRRGVKVMNGAPLSPKS